MPELQACIVQVYFQNTAHAFIAAITNPWGSLDDGGIYETLDTGNTWKRITPEGMSIGSVYAVGNIIVGVEKEYYIESGNLVRSTNDGESWDSIRSIPGIDLSDPNFQQVCGNRDSLIAAMLLDSMRQNPNLIYSADMGQTWHLIPVSNPVAYRLDQVAASLYSFPFTCDLMRQAMDQNNSDAYDFWIGPPEHAASDKISLPQRETGIPTGSSCSVYICNAGELPTNDSGFVRTTDRGSTWVDVPGPLFGEIDDFKVLNLCVTGYGSTVYAFDIDWKNLKSRFWKSTDGGDGTLSADALAPRVLLDRTLSSGGRDTLKLACDSGVVTVFDQNLRCAPTRLSGISIKGLDSSEYTVKQIRHSVCEDLPDTTLFVISSSKLGLRILTVRAHFIDDEFAEIDTSFSFALLTTLGDGNRVSIYLKPISLSGEAGDTVDVPVYISADRTSVEPDSISVELSYFLNTDLLTPITFIPMKGVTADPLRTTRTTAIVTLHVDPGVTFGSETELGRLRCVAHATDTMQTDIVVAGTTKSWGCLETLADSVAASFTLTGCGSRFLTQFMKLRTIGSILSIVPNPAETGITVILENNGSLLVYELFDALGTIVRRGTTLTTTLSLDVSSLTNGTYYLRVSSPDTSPSTKQITILR